jgi:hypothetical protein
VPHACGGSGRVRVQMMFIMLMLMGEDAVRMLVLVPLGQVNPYADSHAKSRSDESRGNRFVKQ